MIMVTVDFGMEMMKFFDYKATRGSKAITESWDVLRIEAKEP